MTPSSNAACAIGLLIALGCTGCGRRPRPDKTPGQPAPDSPAATEAPTSRERTYGQITLRGTTLTGRDQAGTVRWRAKARSIEVDEASERAVLRHVACTFLEADRPVSRYEAGTMVTDFSRQGARQIHFTDDVTATSMVSGVEAEFGQVTYLWDEKRIVDAMPASVTKGATRVLGDRLEADVALRRVQVYGAPGRALVSSQ